MFVFRAEKEAAFELKKKEYGIWLQTGFTLLESEVLQRREEET
jgi:hypothetical protein